MVSELNIFKKIFVCIQHSLKLIIEFLSLHKSLRNNPRLLYTIFCSHRYENCNKASSQSGKSSTLGLCHVVCYWLEPRTNLLLFIINNHLTTLYQKKHLWNRYSTERDEPILLKEINFNCCIKSINLFLQDCKSISKTKAEVHMVTLSWSIETTVKILTMVVSVSNWKLTANTFQRYVHGVGKHIDWTLVNYFRQV